MTTVTPVNLLQLDEYRAPRENLFPSRASLEWFVRQHRAELGQEHEGSKSSEGVRLLSLVVRSFRTDQRADEERDREAL